jgi:hypothetical protein
MFKRVVAVTASMLILVAATGCTGSSPAADDDTSSATATATATVPPQKTLAYGAFAPANGVSGTVTVAQVDDTVTVTLDSFRDGGHPSRLLLVDAAADGIGSCIPDAVATASVGGSPAGPTSSFPLASADDMISGMVPEFRSAVLVRSHQEGDPECVEPVVAVAALQWE